MSLKSQKNKMAKKQSYIEQARKELTDAGNTEVAVRQDLPGVDEIWREIQTLKQEMNVAKRAAAE